MYVTIRIYFGYHFGKSATKFYLRSCCMPFLIIYINMYIFFFSDSVASDYLSLDASISVSGQDTQRINGNGEQSYQHLVQHTGKFLDK